MLKEALLDTEANKITLSTITQRICISICKVLLRCANLSIPNFYDMYLCYSFVSILFHIVVSKHAIPQNPQKALHISHGRLP